MYVCQLVEQIECRCKCCWLSAGESEKQLPLTDWELKDPL